MCSETLQEKQGSKFISRNILLSCATRLNWASPWTRQPASGDTRLDWATALVMCCSTARDCGAQKRKGEIKQFWIRSGKYGGDRVVTNVFGHLRKISEDSSEELFSSVTPGELVHTRAASPEIDGACFFCPNKNKFFKKLFLSKNIR